jgi:hypothetical protein
MAKNFDPANVDKSWFINKSGRLSFLFEAKEGGTKIRDGGCITGISYSSAARIGDETAEVVKFSTGTGHWQARYKLLTEKGVRKKQDSKVPALQELSKNLQAFVGTYLPTTYYLSLVDFHLSIVTHYLLPFPRFPSLLGSLKKHLQLGPTTKRKKSVVKGGKKKAGKKFRKLAHHVEGEASDDGDEGDDDDDEEAENSSDRDFIDNEEEPEVVEIPGTDDDDDDDQGAEAEASAPPSTPAARTSSGSHPKATPPSAGSVAKASSSNSNKGKSSSSNSSAPVGYGVAKELDVKYYHATGIFSSPNSIICVLKPCVVLLQPSHC